MIADGFDIGGSIPLVWREREREAIEVNKK